MKNKIHPKQIRLNEDLYLKAKNKASNIGLNFSSYIRNLISKDLGYDKKE